MTAPARPDAAIAIMARDLAAAARRPVDLNAATVTFSQTESVTPAGLLHKLRVLRFFGRIAGDDLILSSNARVILASVMRDCELLARSTARKRP